MSFYYGTKASKENKWADFYLSRRFYDGALYSDTFRVLSSAKQPNYIKDICYTESINICVWAQTCGGHHLCLKTQSSRYIPPWMIYCKSDSFGLVEASQINMRKFAFRYATPSHRRGPNPSHLPLQTDNINRFYKEINYSDLPRTFKNAMATAKRLGIHFIWIDSLCIIQKGPL